MNGNGHVRCFLLSLKNSWQQASLGHYHSAGAGESMQNNEGFQVQQVLGTVQ